MDIVLIGAGNVGQHLAIALKRAGHRIVQVHGRGTSRARALARRLGAKHLGSLDEIDLTADLILLAIPDDAIPALLQQLPGTKQLIVHTAGPVPLRVFGRKFPHAGVFYPLQTFSEGRSVRFDQVPLLLEAKTLQDRRTLGRLGRTLSREVHYIDSKQRQWLHLAGVLVNNFTNHLLHQAEGLLRTHRLPFPLLLPLIQETVDKASDLQPSKSQTGPARRGDRKTMARHLAMLSGKPRLRKLYLLMSESIAATRKR